jgi:hypothetical protein
MGVNISEYSGKSGSFMSAPFEILSIFIGPKKHEKQNRLNMAK